MHAAAVCNKLDLVKCLAQAGAKLDTEAGYRGTALQIACHHGYQDLARYLIEGGATTSLRDGQGRTMLHGAANHGHSRLAQDLLQRALMSMLRTMICVQRSTMLR